MAKILIVDDDSLMVRMYQTKFKGDGFSVDTASNGEEGLEKAVANKPDLILLDVMMPKVNGLEMLQRVKRDIDIKDTPVVILSNVGEEGDVNKGLEMGAVSYLVKASYTPKQVVEKVKEILAGYKREVPEVKADSKASE
jgi:DNA-binding response OmpR family regulator